MKKRNPSKMCFLLLVALTSALGIYLQSAERTDYILEKPSNAEITYHSAAPTETTSTKEAASSVAPTSGKININTASKEELMTLDGIGEKKAGWIIEYRELHGSFQTVQDIMKVSGIGKKTFESLKDYICV